MLRTPGRFARARAHRFRSAVRCGARASPNSSPATCCRPMCDHARHRPLPSGQAQCGIATDTVSSPARRGNLGRARSRPSPRAAPALVLLDRRRDLLEAAYGPEGGKLYLPTDLLNAAAVEAAAQSVRSSASGASTSCATSPAAFAWARPCTRRPTPTGASCSTSTPARCCTPRARSCRACSQGGGGRSSTSARTRRREVSPKMGAYVASKSAVIRLTETMAAEIARQEHQRQLRVADDPRHAGEPRGDARCRSAQVGGAGRPRQRDRVPRVRRRPRHSRRGDPGDRIELVRQRSFLVRQDEERPRNALLRIVRPAKGTKVRVLRIGGDPMSQPY